MVADNHMEIDMNKAQLTNLFETGAIFDEANCQIFHPSFRKGFRKMSSYDVSWQGFFRANDERGTNKLIKENRVYRFK